VNRNVFRVADRLAKKGFFVVMPDFYRGKPWPLKNFPPKDRKEFDKWFDDTASLSGAPLGIFSADVSGSFRFLACRVAT
jgi:dienelactone hydrolase